MLWGDVWLAAHRPVSGDFVLIWPDFDQYAAISGGHAVLCTILGHSGGGAIILLE